MEEKNLLVDHGKPIKGTPGAEPGNGLGGGFSNSLGREFNFNFLNSNGGGGSGSGFAYGYGMTAVEYLRKKDLKDRQKFSYGTAYTQSIFTRGNIDGAGPSIRHENFDEDEVIPSNISNLERFSYSAAVLNSLKLITEAYNAALLSNPSNVRADIGEAISSVGAPHDLSPLQRIELNKAIVDELISARHNEYQVHQNNANAFFGSDPLTKSARDVTLRIPVYQGAETARVYREWVNSVVAAYTAKVVAESIKHLSNTSKELEAQLANQQKLARQQTEAAARHHAQQQAEAIAKKQTEDAAQKAQADANARAQANAQATLKAVVAAPSVTPAAQGAAKALEAAINQARRQFIRTATGALVRSPALAAALYSAKLGNGERTPTAGGTPLSQINFPAGVDLQYVASTQGTVELAHRLVPGESGAFNWNSTDGVKLGTKVRVRTPDYNAQNHTYEFTRDGEYVPELVWTPAVSPGNSSTISPGTPPSLPGAPGFPAEPVVPQNETHPAYLDDPDDYILFFPADAGLEPLYIVFQKSPRYMPGTATGFGQPVTGTWLGEGTRNKGVPIPSGIADQLRGRNFSDFDKFRKAFWTAVATDPQLLKQFSQSNQTLITSGKAPKVREVDTAAGRTTFELHHVVEIQYGGEVYSMDNIQLVTPKAHNIITKENRK